MMKKRKDVMLLLFGNKTIGQTIRDVRKSKKISQEVLSGLAGIGRTHLTMIESGTKQANFATLCKIANALEMNPSELVQKIEEHWEANQK